MTREDALVSVVVPTHYRNDRLQRAIESVAAQTYEPVELVVVDDSGEAHASPVVPEWATYIAFDRNRGANRARTAGIERASGAYVQLLDDDDQLRPEKVTRGVELLEAEEEIGVAYCGMCYENGGSVSPGAAVRGDVLHHALAFDMSPCLTSTMLVDATVLDAACPLADRPGADDLGLMIELALRTRFDYTDAVLVDRGRIEGSRGQSLGVVEGRKQILTEYRDHYREAPDGVRAAALADTYRLEGDIRAGSALWSPMALAAYARSLRHGPSLWTTAWLCASLAGRPGRRLLRATLRAIS